MKIGIISDSHDHLENLRKAMAALNGCEALIHCGDWRLPFVVKELGNFPGKVYTVVGNNPGDLMACMKLCPGNVEIGNVVLECELGGKSIAVTHYPEVADSLAATGKYDAVFYGHTHTKDSRKAGKTLVANPGDLMGLKGEAGYAVYDTETNEVTMNDI